MKKILLAVLLALILMTTVWYGFAEARGKTSRRIKPTPAALQLGGQATPAATPTATPTPTPSPSPTTMMAAVSAAFGIWDPSMPIYKANGPQKYPTCSKSEHDRFFVIGPDGLKYPTWHPPVITDSTGVKCTFGHEHGKDPSKYEYFESIRRHFAFDADHNGTIDANELATSGIPFGYVNQQLDLANVKQMRHEDHVGHKIEYVNGEGDIKSPDGFGNALTGGIVIPQKTASGSPKWTDSGIRCSFFDKVHQGVHSPDALTNNVHEVIFHAKCTGTRVDYPANESLISGLVAFGNPGEFTQFCGANRNTVIKLGTDANNALFPHGEQGSMRNIGTRSCIEKNFLVPAGSWSSFPYEIWSGGLTLRRADGTMLAATSGGWEVLDAIRYYDPRTSNRIGYVADTCYETLGDRKMRGGACEQMTNYGTIAGITWNDTRSAFKGIHRGQYMNPPLIANDGGQKVWYTDVYGNKASMTPFAGAIKQLVPAVKATLSFDHDPRNVLEEHADGEGTVHAPN